MAAGRPDERNARSLRVRGGPQSPHPRRYHHHHHHYYYYFASVQVVGLPVSRQTAWRPTVRITRNRSLSPSLSPPHASYPAVRGTGSLARSRLAGSARRLGFSPKGALSILSLRFLARFSPCDLNLSRIFRVALAMCSESLPDFF